MGREEKRKKLTEALVNMLYPPPRSPPPEPEDVETPLKMVREDLDLDSVPDNVAGSDSPESEDGDSESETGPQKLTRAQRKRLRKKKLKEEAIQRGNIVGPLLPRTPDVETEKEPPGVRQNDTEEAALKSEKTPPAHCTNENRVKHRRLAKKHGKEKLKPSSENYCDQYERAVNVDQGMNLESFSVDNVVQEDDFNSSVENCGAKQD